MRPLSSVLRNLPRAPLFLAWFLKAGTLFQRPLAFLGHYLSRTSPKEGVVSLRDGTRIHLSGHPHDVITLFVVFVREEYGRFPPGGTVVDIGANLGAFTLWAARLGAAKVLAYEPNAAAYRCLVRNVEANGLAGRVVARALAVTGAAGKTVRFPVAASVYNRAAPAGADGEFETVATTSLAEILRRDAPEGIDLLKLDCEGAEYEILGAASPADLARVREVRMEYHGGRVAELRGLLERAGFAIKLEHAEGAANGTLWAARA